MPKLTKSDQTERMCMYVTPVIRDLIDDAAKKHNRSRTQEINSIVEQYFAAQDSKKESVASTPSER